MIEFQVAFDVAYVQGPLAWMSGVLCGLAVPLNDLDREAASKPTAVAVLLAMAAYILGVVA